MKKILFFVVLMQVFILFPLEIDDEDLQEATEKQIELELKQQQEIELEEKEKKIEELEKNYYKMKILEQDSLLILESGLPKFYIREIEILDNIILNKKEIKNITSNYIDKKINLNDIRNLTRALTNYCISKGYPTMRVQIPLNQNLNSGILQLKIINGFIEEFLLNENRFIDRSKIFFAFPFKKGKILKIGDIDQGLEQLNRLPSNNIIMKILPGSKKESSKILLNNSSNDFFRMKLEFDNKGSETTGEIRRKINFDFDNLLQINDNWSLSYQENNDSYRKDRYSRNYSANMNFPFGFWLFSSSYNYSEYLMTIEGLSKTFESSGNSQTQNYSIKKTLFRKKREKLTSSISLSIKDNESFIEDVQTVTGTKRLAVGEWDFRYSTMLFGGTNSYEIIYNRGLDFFGAKKDDDIENGEPEAQFDKYTTNIYWNKYFPFFKQRFNFSLDASGQYSEDYLFGGDKFSAGGSANVISGEKGYNIKGSFGYTIPYLSTFGFLNRYLTRIQPSIFSNFGHVQNPINRDKNDVFDVGGSLKYYGNYLTIDFSYSKPIIYPTYLEPPNELIEISISFNLNSYYKKSKQVIKQVFTKKEIKEDFTMDEMIDEDNLKSGIPIIEEKKRMKEKKEVISDSLIPLPLDIDKDDLSIKNIRSVNGLAIGEIIAYDKENLSLFALWSKIPIEEIMELNKIELVDKIYYQDTILIPLIKIDKKTFEDKRLSYRRQVENEFWKGKKLLRVVKYRMEKGSYIWDLNREKFNLPLWLMQRYNKNINFDKIEENLIIQIPIVE